MKLILHNSIVIITKTLQIVWDPTITIIQIQNVFGTIKMMNVKEFLLNKDVRNIIKINVKHLKDVFGNNHNVLQKCVVIYH